MDIDRIPRIYGCVRLDGESLSGLHLPFRGVLGAPVVGGPTSELATKAHTNLHRSNRLEVGQELDLRAPGGLLRARFSEAMAEPVAAFAATTTARFKVQDKPAWEGTLIDLALEAVRVEAGLVTSEYDFGLELQCCDAGARKALWRHLSRAQFVDIEDLATVQHEARIVCDAVSEAAERAAARRWWQKDKCELSRASVGGQRVLAAIGRLRCHPRQLTIWCSLDARPSAAHVDAP